MAEGDDTGNGQFYETGHNRERISWTSAVTNSLLGGVRMPFEGNPQDFKVKYDGPALESHEMNAKDLANSILSLADAIQYTQLVCQTSDNPLDLKVKGLQGGSFDIWLTIADAMAYTNSIFQSDGVQAAKQISETIMIVFAAVAGIKTIRGRAFKKVADTEIQNENIEIEFPDGTKMSMHSNVYLLISHPGFRKALKGFVSPLSVDGITDISARYTDEIEQIHLDKEDLQAFEVPPQPEEMLTSSTSERVLKIVSVEFDFRKWRFSDGNSSYYAALEDEQFKADIENNASLFGIDDTLTVQLRTEQFFDSSGNIKSNYFIEKVVKHNRGGRQLTFDFDE